MMTPRICPPFPPLRCIVQTYIRIPPTFSVSCSAAPRSSCHHVLPSLMFSLLCLSPSPYPSLCTPSAFDMCPVVPCVVIICALRSSQEEAVRKKGGKRKASQPAVEEGLEDKRRRELEQQETARWVARCPSSPKKIRL